MEIITKTKQKQKVNLTSFFSSFTEKPNVPVKTDKNYSPLVSSAFVSGQLVDTFKNNDELANFKSEKLHEILNRFIENGITFDVSTTDFQFVDRAQRLKTSDKQFLELNSADILCQLQQSLLMKHLFSHSPERFEVFAFEIRERESLLTKTDEKDFEIYFQIVKSVTRKWFDELLKEKDIPMAAFDDETRSQRLH